VLGGEFMILFLSITLGIFSSSVIFFLGDIDIHLKYLISVVILDYFTGLLKAFLKKKINSSISIKGIFKKISYFVVVGVSVMIGNILNMKDALRNLVIYSFLLSEIISILENCTEMGIRLPKLLISSLEVFQKKINKMDDESIKKEIKD